MVAEPGATFSAVTALDLLSRTVMLSGVVMAWTTVEPLLPPLEAVTVTSPPEAGVVRTSPSTVPAEAPRA